MDFSTLSLRQLVDFIAETMLSYEGKHNLDDAVIWLLKEYPDFPYSKKSMLFDKVVCESLEIDG